jgi:hypothetical protein
MDDNGSSMAVPPKKTSRRKPQTIDLAPEDLRETVDAASEAPSDMSADGLPDHATSIDVQSVSDIASSAGRDDVAQSFSQNTVQGDETERRSAPSAFPVVMAGALAGFAVAALMMLLPNLFGNDLAGRITALESRSTALPAPPADLKPVQDRLALLEEGLPSAEKAATATQAQLKATETDLAALRQRIEQISKAEGAGIDPTVLRTIEERLAAGETNIQVLKQEIEALKAVAEQANQAVASPAIEKAARLAAADALQRRFQSGEPFATELEAAGAFAPDLSALKMLRETASTGTPSYARLETDFIALTGAINAAIQPSTDDAGFLQRLAQSATNLVEVTPVEGAGTDPSSLLGQVATAIRNGQAGVALTTLENLPEAAKKAANPTLEALRTRISLDSALAELSSSVIEPSKVSQ